MLVVEIMKRLSCWNCHRKSGGQEAKEHQNQIRVHLSLSALWKRVTSVTGDWPSELCAATADCWRQKAGGDCALCHALFIDGRLHKWSQSAPIKIISLIIAIKIISLIIECNSKQDVLREMEQ
jgi:hypothetical protein